MRKYLFLLVILLANCLFAFAQTATQTRTATFLNNLYNFQQVYGNQNYPRARVQDVAANDNIYTCTSKLTSEKDSGWTRSTALSTLALQGFGFTIPDDATIENIVLKVRRFKKGTPSVGDHILSLIQRFEQTSPDAPSFYGVMWTFMDDEELDYAGRIYPATETEYLFSQSGRGNNGWGFHDQPYEWTPAMVNAITFGVRIMNYQAIGKGTVQICYDLVEVTVEYSEPATKAGRSSVAAEVKPLTEPIIYPNPFTTKANIQFTAAETGSAVVELYNITGVKIRTLFSANVIQGQTYNVAAGDAQLPTGVYVYMIRNGKQKHTGRIIKLEQ